MKGIQDAVAERSERRTMDAEKNGDWESESFSGVKKPIHTHIHTYIHTYIRI